MLSDTLLKYKQKHRNRMPTIVYNKVKDILSKSIMNIYKQVDDLNEMILLQICVTFTWLIVNKQNLI